MKKALAVLAGVTALSTFTMAETVGFEAGLVSPIQVASPEASVDGFRLSTIWTVNQDVKGFDWSWIASKTEGTFNGFRLGGLYDQIDNGGEIYQLGGFINNVKGDAKVGYVFTGVALNEKAEGFRAFSFVNYAEEMKGVDIGFVNFDKKMEGFQFGFFNYAEELNGYQIGLINYAKNSTIFPVLPIFNMAK